MTLIKESVIISCESDGTRFLDWRSSRMDTKVTAIVEEQGTELKNVKQTLEDTSRIVFHGLSRDRRYHYRLIDSYGNEVLQSERQLPFHGSKNFRDCGGYPTKQGSEVKWGNIFRSGQLSKLDDQDTKLIESLNLDLIFDFRREDEQEMEYEDEEDSSDTPFMLPMSQQLMDDMAMLSNYECWVGHTNFDITPKVRNALDTIEGIELLKVCSRYRFFIGVGKMFDFKEVRNKIENNLTIERSD